MNKVSESSERLYHEHFIRPQTFKSHELLANKNQVAGHTGFYSVRDDPGICLKPFNIKCVRGRREHLFYQLLEYMKISQSSREVGRSTLNSQNIINDHQPIGETPSELPLYYSDFPLLTYPETKCKCNLDRKFFELLSLYVVDFYHVKHISSTNSNFNINDAISKDFHKALYSKKLSCPCYWSDPKMKSSCSKDYDKIDFLCLRDLTTHCQEPCIVDIKIGQITYDPMATREKISEQVDKYKRLREFGFRILGMKMGGVIRDKYYGRNLHTAPEVIGALDSFFHVLRHDSHKIIVIDSILNRLENLLRIFEENNVSQLKFFSSSLLIVYDMPAADELKTSTVIEKKLSESVKVSMIDFAHVFHVHGCTIESYDDGSFDQTPVDVTKSEKDYNYIYGLKKLICFLYQLKQSYESSSM